MLLLGLLALLGVSIADSRPLELDGFGSLSAVLPVVMVAAGLIGYLLARSALGVVRAHLLGALIAATVLLFVAGGAVLGRSPLPTSIDGVGELISAVWMRLDADIASLQAGEITTSTLTVFLVLGALCWTTAQFGAFSVFRYDRGGPAVMAVGTILFLNVGLGSLQAQEDLLPVVPVLAIFASLALLLLMRLQLVQQRYAWARRHISDATDVSRLFIRTGVVFVLVAVVSASSLTVWATVDAQEVDIDGIEEPLEDLVDQLAFVLDIIGVPRDVVPQTLGASTKLRTTWEPGSGTAFSAEFVAGQLYDNYWWGKADDFYDPDAAEWRTTTEVGRPEVAAGRQLTPRTQAGAGGENQVEVVVSVGDGGARVNVFRPPDVLEVQPHSVYARRTAGGGYSDLEYVDRLDDGDAVRIASWVRDYRPLTGDLTGNELRAAGRRYPDFVESYLQGGEDRRIIGPNSRAFMEQIKAAGDTPYDWALAAQEALRSMTYNPDLGEACNEFSAFTECLLAIEQGFCQQYATTMVMIMRALGVPARFVTGYLPGERDELGRWVVPQEALHNWAEVYFPGYGWVRFDPTPGDLGQVPTELEDGEEIGGQPRETPDSNPEVIEPEVEELEDTPPPIPGPDDPEPPGDGGQAAIVLGLVALAGALAAVVGSLLLIRLRRLPGGDDSLAYRGIVSLATRLGYGPHPSQTEYEYASTLSETIPSVRHDLYLVTDAQVQATYGERRLDEAHRGRLRSAYARIRTALLRLSLRWRR